MGSVTTQHFEEYPPKVSLAKDVYRPFPTQPASISQVDDPVTIVSQTLTSLATALGKGDVEQVKGCFLAQQAYWRDVLAFTWHMRTFTDKSSIAPALVELAKARFADGGDVIKFQLDEASVEEINASIHCPIAASPKFKWIEGMFTFETNSPAARCGGRVMLCPEEGGSWKIWALSTWVDDLVASPQDMDALKAPSQRKLEEEKEIETDVFILGGGNGGIIAAARLKALGLDPVIVDRNQQPGDNWALRYDCLRFHIAKSNCETPYLQYPEELPVILTRQHATDQMKRYVEAFNLNILHGSWVEASSFNTLTKTWKINLCTPFGPKTVKAKHLVQATGVGSATPYVPEIPGAETYKGVNIHSVEYKNPTTLTDKGAKSVIIIGSANSAFDIMEDCADSGLQTTMNARSPTYIFPWEYALAPEGLGVYDIKGPELADKLQMSSPHAVIGQLVVNLHAKLADKEPDRYKALAAKGFPLYDSVGGKGDLFHHLLERGGGHFNDIGGGVELLVSGKVAVKGNVHAVAYTETGLEFSDGSKVDADAIVWCTGFRDKDRSVTSSVLGGRRVDVEEDKEEAVDAVIGPHEVATRRDAVWGVDKEGELRGVFKRHLRVENYWIFGGTAAMHRYYSLPLALQIRAAIDGTLPEAYRETPGAEA